MEALWLVHNGIPFDTAFQLDDVTRGAFAIIFGNFQRPPDQQFDWSLGAFPEAR